MTFGDSPIVIGLYVWPSNIGKSRGLKKCCSKEVSCCVIPLSRHEASLSTNNNTADPYLNSHGKICSSSYAIKQEALRA